jgi:hypothetical protein
MAESTSIYRAMHHLRKNGLHDALHIPHDETIPEDRVQKAKHSNNEHVAHMANMAANMKNFKKG